MRFIEKSLGILLRRSTDPAEEIHGIVYDDFFPKMAAIFNEFEMEGVLLVGGLCVEVAKEHQFRDLPGGVDDVSFRGVRGDADVELFYEGDAGECLEPGYELVAVPGGGGVLQPKEDMVNDRGALHTGKGNSGFREKKLSFCEIHL